MAYATVDELQKGFRTLDADDTEKAAALIDEASLIIDAEAPDNTNESLKKMVACRMVRRALGDGSISTVPIGATQGSMSALGYSQSWQMGSSGSSGELYLEAKEKLWLGKGNKIGSHSPLEDLDSD